MTKKNAEKKLACSDCKGEVVRTLSRDVDSQIGMRLQILDNRH